MAFTLSQRSLDRLAPLHPDLQKVVKLAIQISKVDFSVGEGLRTIERQKQLVAQGASQTMNSRHLTGHAVDLVALVDFDGDGDKEVRWDWPLYAEIAKAMKLAASQCKVPLEWGGDWRTLKDGPHFQLPFASYPKPKPAPAPRPAAPAPVVAKKKK